MQRRIERLLDQAEEAADHRDWGRVAESVQMVLSVDPENADALAFQVMLENAGISGSGADSPSNTVGADSGPPEGESLSAPTTKSPTSFANDRYQVSRLLGEGGKKRVYLAHDSLLGRDVAFGLIKTEGFDQASKERISREAQAMGRLGVHPNIVAVLDLGQEADGTPYMVTEFMSGGDVEGLLDADRVRSPSPQTSPADERGGTNEAGGAYSRPSFQGGEHKEPSPSEGGGLGVGRNGLSLERTIEIGKAVCEGLEFAHSRDIIHRDLKPGNVWLTEDGIAKIGDFGLAMMTDRSRLTREAMMIGTPSYMPPEQATGGDMTPKSDLYSLGAMLYEMVTGRPPFLGDEEIAIISQHINTPPVAPTWHNGSCPRPLEALIMRLLAKDPSERPDSAQDVFNALDAIDLTARGETVERDASSLESLAGGVFVGRQAEMDQLKAGLEDVLGGSGRLIALMGEPGIGKTRTSEEFVTYAGLRGAQTLWGRCYETGGQPPYWPWVQAIRSYVREVDADDLRRQMGSSASVMAELITDIKDRLPEVQAPPEIEDPDSARFRLFDSIASFLKSASQTQPLVIVLDDLHWSDRPSLQFLEFMARELGQSRVLLLCTYRDMELNRRHPLTVTLGGLARERLYERVLLRGLTESDVGRFIGIASGVQPPQELSATVYRHTEGNPLFVTEVVRELVQSGDMAESRISGDSTWSVRIPEGVRDVIGRRLDRLSERANDLLTTAAVVGRDFTLNVMKELAEDTTESQLLDVLDEALDARLIEELTDEVGHYQFTHALIQETLTSELSLTRRVRIHARVAETLERVYWDETEDHASELVVHFSEAETVLGTDRLVKYLITAGEAELSAYAFDDAFNYFERARVTAGEEMIAADRSLDVAVHSGLGRAGGVTNNLARRQQAWDNLSRAYRIYVEDGDVANAVRMATNPITLGAIVGATEITREALSLVSHDSAEAGWLWTRHGTCLMDNEADFESADDAFEKALSIALLTSDKALEARAHAHMCQLAFHRLDTESARYHGDLAWRLAVEGGDPPSAFRSQMFCAGAYIFDGMIDEAFGVLDRNLSLTKAYGGSGWRTGTAFSAVGLAICTGEFERARSYMSEHFDPGSGWYEVPGIELWYDLLQGRKSMNDPAVLNEISGLQSHNQEDSGRGQLWVATFNVQVASLTGSTDLIEDVPGSRFPVLSKRHLSWGVTAAMVRGNAAALLDDQESCELIYSELEGMERVVDPESLVSLDRVRARMKTVMGDLETAATHFESAVEQTRKVGARGELAWSLLYFSEMLLDRDDAGDREKAVDLQDEAITLTQDMGMVPLTERILARRQILRA